MRCCCRSWATDDRARRVFREIVESVKGAPGYYRRRQREWTAIARKNI